MISYQISKSLRVLRLSENAPEIQVDSSWTSCCKQCHAGDDIYTYLVDFLFRMFVFLFKLRLVRLVVCLIKRFSLSQALPSSSFSLYLLYLGVYCRRTTRIILQVFRYLHNRHSATHCAVPFK